MSERFSIWPITFEAAIKRILAFDPNRDQRSFPDRTGFCCALVGYGGQQTLQEAGVLCTRRAKFSAVVHLSTIKDDTLDYPGLCGQHKRAFEARGWRVETQPLTRGNDG
jgi:hypothetical protein